MNDEKDRFGEFIKLVERGREDVYFAEKDRQALDKLKLRCAMAQHDPLEAAVIECPRCGASIRAVSLMSEQNKPPGFTSQSPRLSLRHIWPDKSRQIVS